MKKLIQFGVCIGFGLIGCLDNPAAAATNPALATLARSTVVQFSGTEGVSQPFSFNVDIESPDPALNFSLVVGQPISFTVAPGRVISGMIEGIEQLDDARASGHYRVHLVPSIGRLNYRTTSRTFYDNKAIDVVTKVLNDAGLSNIEWRLAGSFPIREITVQYRESDFAFVSRLLEEAGVHYHFETTPAGDRIVLSDGNAGFPISPIGKAVFSNKGAPAVAAFSRGQSMHSGVVQAGDYNWKTPTADLTATAQVPSFSDLTERLYPVFVETKVESQAQANRRLAARVTAGQNCRGESTYPQLEAGHRLLLSGHPRPDFNQEYVILAVEHEVTGKGYRNTFRCLPSQMAYRPSQLTPAPVISGVVSGIVVGPPGETKHVDQFGRVKVRFPWRSPVHSSPGDPGDAGFIRVAQIATGAGAAALWLPDVGNEVLIAFEHGDPDRPVVIGSVYNAKDMPPVALPAAKHVSLFRAQSASGAKSELVYDMSPGNERLLIQSGPNVLTLGANGVLVQGSSFALQAQGTVTMTAGAAMQWQAGTDLVSRVGRNLSLETGKDLVLKAGQNFSAIVGRDAQMTVGEDLAIQTGKSFVTQSGGLFKFVTAQTGTIDSRAGLFLQSPTLISMESKDVTVKASGNLVMKGSKITQN